MAGPGVPEPIALRPGWQRHLHRSTERGLPRGRPNARPWMAGPGVPEPVALRHGGQRHLHRSSTCAMSRVAERPAMDGRGGMLARHWRAFRRAPGHGWPGRAFRSQSRRAMDGSDTFIEAPNAACRATSRTPAMDGQGGMLARHWRAFRRTPGHGLAGPGLQSQSRYAMDGSHTFNRSTKRGMSSFPQDRNPRTFFEPCCPPAET